MLNDIFAASMSGEFRTQQGGVTIEQGQWDYKGYGNAEIRMNASTTGTDSELSYSLSIHSAERQLDEVEFRSRWNNEGTMEEQTLRATIAGHDIDIMRGGSGGDRIGSLTSPDEAIYVGPSPIWIIHLMLTAPLPVDREVVTPVIVFDARHGFLTGKMYRFRREGLHVEIVEMTEDGEIQERGSIELADDGCPQLIRRGDRTTEIIRLPRQHS